MTLQEALDECTLCGLCNTTVSDEHKMQVINKIMSAPSTKVQKVKLCNIITWLLKKKGNEELTERLENAKKIIEELYNIIPASMSEYAKEPMEHARKFMTEEADK